MSFSDYGGAENAIHLIFPTKKKKDQFLKKMSEARENYKQLQQGDAVSSKFSQGLDKMEFEQLNLDSDPDTPDECVISAPMINNTSFPGTRCTLYRPYNLFPFLELDDPLSFDPSSLGLFDNFNNSNSKKEATNESPSGDSPSTDKRSFIARGRLKLGFSKKVKSRKSQEQK